MSVSATLDAPAQSKPAKAPKAPAPKPDFLDKFVTQLGFKALRMPHRVCWLPRGVPNPAPTMTEVPVTWRRLTQDEEADAKRLYLAEKITYPEAKRQVLGTVSIPSGGVVRVLRAHEVAADICSPFSGSLFMVRLCRESVELREDQIEELGDPSLPEGQNCVGVFPRFTLLCDPDEALGLIPWIIAFVAAAEDGKPAPAAPVPTTTLDDLVNGPPVFTLAALKRFVGSMRQPCSFLSRDGFVGAVEKAGVKAVEPGELAKFLSVPIW